MKIPWNIIDVFLILVAIALGIASVFLNDVDKTPIYFILAYLLWRNRSRLNKD